MIRRRAAFAAVLLAVAGLFAAVAARPYWIADALVTAWPEPVRAPRWCWRGKVGEHEVSCFVAYVPENWEKHASRLWSRMIRLPVVRFRPAGRRAKASPVVMVMGGPGAIAYTGPGELGGWKADLAKPALSRRTVIYYDQRGIGNARPALRCPEFQRTLNSPFDRRMTIAAARDCARRLKRTGAELRAYHTVASAEDLSTLRRLLGYRRWSVWGQSYGTRVGLIYAQRRAPEIDALVLDGPYPPSLPSRLYWIRPLRATINAVSRSCGTDPDCSPSGDLMTFLDGVLRQYRREPMMLQTKAADGVPSVRARVDDRLVLAMIDLMMYSREGVQSLPAFLWDLRRRRPGWIRDMVSYWYADTYGPGITGGASIVIECNDEPKIDESDDRAMMDELPEWRRWIAAGIGLDFCPFFVGDRAAALPKEQVSARLPVLIVNGALDHATPLEWGKALAARLPTATLVTVPRYAHDASSARCAQRSVQAFLDQPGGRFPSACNESTVELLKFERLQ